MSSAGNASSHRVVVFIRPRVLSFELSLIHRLFGQARSVTGDALYEVVTCTLAPGPVTTDADFTVEVADGPNLLASADTVIVPGSELDFAEGEAFAEPDVLNAIALRRPGSRVASICSGAFVLAAAGLLDGRRATTHWRSVDRFRKLFPGVLLDADVLYTDDQEVLTSAGAAAGIDLCLHMIRSDHGAAVANDVARGTVVPPHRAGGQAQYIARPMPTTDVSSTSRAREWALTHLDRPITLRELAEHESTSIRTFTRRFRDEIGTSPGEWISRQRLEKACSLLEQTSLSIDEVASSAGFGSTASMRAHFQAELDVSPSAYRTTFRGLQPA
jgi:transcriptional regulator GlxA family with amidase domain